jgi:hypothetical protein
MSLTSLSATLQVKPAEEKAAVPEADTIAAAAAVDPPAGSETGKLHGASCKALAECNLCTMLKDSLCRSFIHCTNLLREGSFHMYLQVVLLLSSCVCIAA